MKNIICFLLLIILCSCGTTQTNLPISPLKSGDLEIKAGIGIALSKFSNISLQVGWNVGLSDRDVLAINMTNSLIPTHFAYSHYFNNMKEKYISNFEFHLGNFISQEYNPDFEVKFGFAQKFDDGSGHRLSAGLAYYGNIIIRNQGKPMISPIFGYNLHINDIMLEANYNTDITKYYISKYTKPQYSKIIRYDDILYFDSNYKNVGNIAPFDSLPSIKIILKDSSCIVIDKGFYYSDDIKRGYLNNKIKAYCTDSNFKSVKVIESCSWKYYAHYCYLDFDKIIDDYNQHKDIIIAIPEELFDRQIINVKQFDDFDIGVMIKSKETF